MEKLQFECEQFKIYAPDSLNYITENMLPILLEKIEEYKIFFDIDSINQLQINYFDDIDRFRNFIYELRGEKESLPKYAVGTFDKGMINGYVKKDIPIESKKHIQKLYLANHELFHILYKKYILNSKMSERIVWYDEGMAMFMSGEYDFLLNDDAFFQFYTNIKATTKKIPKLNEIKHGNSYRNEDYDGYKLSYLAVRYISEVLSEEDFKNLKGDFAKIKEYGETVLINAFEYYDKKINHNIHL